MIGKLSGMGDVVTDDMAVYRKLGPEFVYDSIGTVTRCCEQVTNEQVAARVAFDRTVFDIDPKLPPERHAYAVRLYLGLRRYLEENGYAGYTAHFEEFGADGATRSCRCWRRAICWPTATATRPRATPRARCSWRPCGSCAAWRTSRRCT